MTQSNILPSLTSVFLLGESGEPEWHYAIRIGSDVTPTNKAYAEWIWAAQMQHVRELHESHLIKQYFGGHHE